jgi:uncharacterized membrane protein YphA (DoxX/SURF4 family)
MYIFGGLDAIRNPEGKVEKAKRVSEPLNDMVELPFDTETLVRVNGGIQLVAGSLMAIGKLPRLSALALVASTIPTTYAGHNFWEMEDEETRAMQQIQFFKNLAMTGGLLMVAADTGGRPSKAWLARDAARRAAEREEAFTHAVMHAAEEAVEVAKTGVAAASSAAGPTVKAARRGIGEAIEAAAHAVAAIATLGATRRLSERSQKVARKTMESAEHLVHDGHVRDVAAEVVSRAREALPIAS